MLAGCLKQLYLPSIKLNKLVLFLDQSEFEYEKYSNSGKLRIFEYTFREGKCTSEILF